MGNEKYESPKVEFQEMRLLERVADTCWGYAYAWYDADKDGILDDGEKVSLSSLGLKDKGCQGNAAREALKEYYFERFNVQLTNDDVSTNTGSKVVIPIGS